MHSRFSKSRYVLEKRCAVFGLRRPMTPDCGTARAGQNRSELVDDHDIVVRRSPQSTRIEAATMVIPTDYGLERAAARILAEYIGKRCSFADEQQDMAVTQPNEVAVPVTEARPDRASGASSSCLQAPAFAIVLEVGREGPAETDWRG
jgi:hypothetical protein